MVQILEPQLKMNFAQSQKLCIVLTKNKQSLMERVHNAR